MFFTFPKKSSPNFKHLTVLNLFNPKIVILHSWSERHCSTHLILLVQLSVHFNAPERLSFPNNQLAHGFSLKLQPEGREELVIVPINPNTWS